MNAEEAARIAEDLRQSVAEINAIAQEEERYWLRKARARERKLWKARNRMSMHGKHFLRDNHRRQHKRRSEHIMEE